MQEPLSTKSKLDASSNASGEQADSISASTKSEPINLDLQPKPSSAIIVWMLVIAAVLAVLGYEMHGDRQPAYNVAVSMNGDVSDCEIFVDGQASGKFSQTNKGDNSNTAWLTIDHGKHHIEIKKSGQPLQSKDLEVKGKEYLRFDSGTTSQTN